MDKQRYDFIIGMQAGELKTEVAKAKGDLKKLSQAFKDTIDVLDTAPRGIGVTKELNAARESAARLLAELKKIQATGKGSLSQATPKQRSNIMGGVQETAAKIAAARPSVIETKAIREQQQALSQMQNKAITLRYALYDVGSAAQSAAQALMGFSGAAIMAASAQEAAFSQIEKTLVGEASTEQLESLKNELISLSTQIPVSFQELSKIGMLGSQLGIASDDIASFTEVTAKFSAITGMSVEETAMNFGKIANILGLSATQYQALGSAIAAVGVSTAATEQQIMSTAGQIGAVAKAAGFSASEVIGLSAAFASLKIAPEEARGVVVRTFNEIDRAVQGFSKNSGIGGEKLRVLADIAGTTSADFAKQWGDKTSGGASYIFKKFIEGLSTRNVSQELKRLSLDGVRTSKGLSALAGGFDLVIKSMEISREAGIAGTFLDESFATIVEDFASKLTMLKNSFDNLMAASAGGPILDALGSIVEMITKANDALTKMIQDGGIIGSFAGFVVVITGVVGALAALAAVIAVAGGGFLALRTAYLAAAASGATFQGGLVGLIMSFGQLLGLAPATAAGVAGVGAAAKGASVGVAALTTQMRLARLALIGTGIGVALVLFGELAAMFMDTGDSAEQSVTGLDEVQQGLKEVRDAANATTQELVDFINQALLPITNMVKVENALFSLGESLRNGAKDFSVYSKTGRANITALQATIDAFAVASQGDQQVLANNLNALMNYMIQAGLGTAEAFAIIQSAIVETGKTAQDVLLPFTSLEAGMQQVGSSASGAAKEVDKLAEAFERLDKRVKLEESLDAFGESLAENGKKLNAFSKGGRANFDALRDVIFSLRDRLANKPQSLANALASLKVAMMQMGITSKLAFRMVDIAIETTGKKGKALKKLIEGLFNTISQSAEDAKPLRTITDYVNDLSSVLDSAFNNRYAKQDASDSIASAWIEIAESAEAAKKSIDEANASINEMQADKNILEYQLQVAIRYGDTLRAESIKAKLAKLNQQMADKQQELADAQAETNKTLVGNSKYAIENRSKVRDLVQSYNEYLTSLAATGMSSEDLKAEAAKLAEEFLSQGESMGFARDELLVYTDAFKRDFTTVIDNLPKDVTLNVVTDPALQAVIDFVKDTNAELAKILSGTVNVNIPGVTTGFPSGPVARPGTGSPSGGNNAGANAGANAGTNAGANATAQAQALVEQRRAALKVVQNKIAAQEKLMKDTEKLIKGLKLDLTFAKPANRPPIQAKIDTLDKLLATQTAKRNSFYPALQQAVKALEAAQAAVPRPASSSRPPVFMKDGGLVRGPGSGTADKVKAMLSNGEYVIRANAVRYYGTEFMNSLNQMGMNKPVPVGGKSNVVYLSPDDRALLRAAIDRPISLYTENTRIAESANAGNVILAQRGMK